VHLLQQTGRFRNGAGASRWGLPLLVLAALTGGCETKSFFDPSEMGRYSKTPHIVQILKNLDVGLEEQPDDRFVNAQDVRPSDLVRVKGDYVIGPNDLVQVSISDLIPGLPESYKTSRVTESGYISLPVIDQIKAAGLTEAQLEQTISQAYRDKQILLNARVSVVTIEARNRTFSVYGAVLQPGQYQILDSDFRLLDALILARDVTSPTGIDYVYVKRKLEYDPKDGQIEGTAPMQAPTAPSTQPTPDILAPRSQAIDLSSPKLLQAAGQSNEGRIFIIDGRQMQVQNGQLVPVNPPAPGAENPAPPSQQPNMPPPPAQPGMTPAPGPMAGPSTNRDFEFNVPTEPTDVRIIRIPFEQLKKGELKYNIIIRPQDFIWVPQPAVGEYYMGGHVQRTGVYSLTARNITLKQAVISSGMLDQLAIPRRTQIVRRIGDNKEIFARVDLSKIFAGEEPDIILKPEDQIMVGTTAYAPFLAAFRNGFRITYGFGFLYDRNYFAPNGTTP
jgi:polysaccharide export outer membrane protein